MSKCFIVPSHVYNHLLEHGDEEQKSLAQNAIAAIKEIFLNQRSLLAGIEYQPHRVEAEQEEVNRTIYDAQNKTTLPGKKVRGEGEKSNGDEKINKAYDFSGETFDFFFKNYKRNSIDDAGMELKSVINYGRNFANAFWNSEFMVYGNGDGRVFNTFLIRDVVAHELSHGVTEHSARLEYYSQSGALNESFSDVFGSLVKQTALNQTVDKADWLIGEGLFTKNINGKALRSLKNPGTAFDDPTIGKDIQPDHMSKYVNTNSDAGGVHINSGIINRAFCNTALNIGGYAWEKAGLIWYKTLTTELKPKSNFQDCVNATVKVADRLYGAKSIERKAVIDGWNVVGLKPKN